MSLGDSVAKGQQMAVISDPLGDAEYPVPAPFDGIVIGRSNLPLAHEGDALVNLASFKEHCTLVFAGSNLQCNIVIFKKIKAIS